VMRKALANNQAQALSEAKAKNQKEATAKTDKERTQAEVERIQAEYNVRLRLAMVGESQIRATSSATKMELE
jgi:hypothetical protein